MALLLKDKRRLGESWPISCLVHFPWFQPGFKQCSVNVVESTYFKIYYRYSRRNKRGWHRKVQTGVDQIVHVSFISWNLRWSRTFHPIRHLVPNLPKKKCCKLKFLIFFPSYKIPKTSSALIAACKKASTFASWGRSSWNCIWYSSADCDSFVSSCYFCFV